MLHYKLHYLEYGLLTALRMMILRLAQYSYAKHVDYYLFALIHMMTVPQMLIPMQLPVINEAIATMYIKVGSANEATISWLK